MARCSRNSGEFDGFQALLTADGGADVAAVGGGITAANVIAEIGKVRDGIADAVYGQDDLCIFMGRQHSNITSQLKQL